MFFLATFLLGLALHSTVYRGMSVQTASACIVLGRPLIAFSVSWFIITNACGYNCEFSLSRLSIFFVWSFIKSLSTGLVSKFFSSKIFVRTNKLTYAIYLLNPIIITLAFGTFDNGGSVDPILYLFLLVGITAVTYVCSIVFSLLFEIPFYKLSSEILKGSSPTSPLSTAPVKKLE